MSDYVQLKNPQGQPLKPVTDLAAINMTTTNGIQVVPANGGTIGITSGYIDSAYYVDMVSEDVGPASTSSAYIEGGTATLITGAYTVTSAVNSSTPSQQKIPSEAAVVSALDNVVTSGTSYYAGTGIAIDAGHTVSVSGVPTSAVAGLDTQLTNINAAVAAKQDAISAGYGLNLSGQTLSLAPAEVQAVLNGTQTVEAVDVSALRGALTAGQAVDVTSQPDSVTGDYRGTFTVTGSLGFASFPKYASGLNYLFLADLTATTSGTVTPSGTWLDGTTTAKSLAAGIPTRVAMLFNAANKAKFTFASTGSVSVTNCREYEVTACSAEAIAYIAMLNNQDAFADYYLVKADMVQPWVYIIDMGTSPAVTIASGLSYKLNASTGTHTLTADTCPAGYDGRDATIRITLGGAGVVQAVAPLQLGDALVPYAINNCVVKFRDGEAVLLVEDTLAGYVVTVTSGTGEGSLPYGLAATGIPYIAFSTGTNGSVINMDNAVTANEEVTAVGNGYTNTTITGNITCTNKTTVANLGLQDVTVTGGTLTLGDVCIPSGGTVSVSGGRVAVEKVSGNGGVIDLGRLTHVAVSRSDTPSLSNCVISNGFAPDVAPTATGVDAKGGAFSIYGGMLVLSGVTITGCTARYGGGICIWNLNSSFAMLDNCIISGNSATAGSNVGNDILVEAGSVSIRGCTIGDISTNQNTKTTVGGVCTIGSIHQRSATNGGLITISSGASIVLTNSIYSVGGVEFEQGGATIIPNGSSALAFSLGGMTVQRVGNTKVVDFGKKFISAGNGEVIASGATLTNAGSASVWGALFTGSGSAHGYFSNCLISGNAGLSGAVAALLDSANADFVSCTIVGNTYSYCGAFNVGSNSVLTLSGCTIGAAQNTELNDGGGSAVLAGSNVLLSVITGTGSAGVTISSGAVINLSGNTNAIPIIPGGAITIPASAIVTILGSGGSSGYFSELALTGSTITNTGLIYGATVYSHAGDDHGIGYTTDGGVTTSEVFVSGETTYVVPGGLIKISNS